MSEPIRGVDVTTPQDILHEIDRLRELASAQREWGAVANYDTLRVWLRSTPALLEGETLVDEREPSGEVAAPIKYEPWSARPWMEGIGADVDEAIVAVRLSDDPTADDNDPWRDGFRQGWLAAREAVQRFFEGVATTPPLNRRNPHQHEYDGIGRGWLLTPAVEEGVELLLINPAASVEPATSFDEVPDAPDVKGVLRDLLDHLEAAPDRNHVDGPDECSDKARALLAALEGVKK